MNHSKFIPSIEMGRVVAIFAVIILHCALFTTYWIDGESEIPWVGYIVNQATRFAVPLFFIISGYLVQPKMSANPMATFGAYSSPLLRLFIVWSLICMATPFYWQVVFEHGYMAERSGYFDYLTSRPWDSLLEGGLVHLWFLPALIMAAFVTAVCVRFKALAVLLPIGFALYFYGVLAGAYQGLTEIPSPFFTRNGPFYSTLMFGLGFMIRQHDFKLSSGKALGVAALGMAMHFGEGFYLHSQAQAMNSIDYNFGTFLWGTGLFLWLLANPNMGNQPWIQKLAKWTLPIYVAHLPLNIAILNILGMLQIPDGPGRDMMVFSGTILITLAFVKLIEITPLNKVIFR